MKPTILLLLLVLSGCSKMETATETLSKMTSPVIVVSFGKNKYECQVLVVDSAGRAETFDGLEYCSLKPGDTLK